MKLKIKETFSDFFVYVIEVIFKGNASGEVRQNQSIEISLKLIEMDFKARELEANIKLTQAEILKSIIQAESMMRSVRDNALISKANAYVGFLNVVLNAQAMANDRQGSTSHSQNVVRTISEINDSFLKDYDEILKELKHDALQLTRSDGDNKQ